jgi:putative IMPACT (imprinted ancient) family translation regulator
MDTSTFLDFEHLHHLIAQVVDYFDGDAAGLGFLEGA